MRLEALVAIVLVLALLGTWSISISVEQQVQARGISAIKADTAGFVALMAEQWRHTAERIDYLQDIAGQTTRVGDGNAEAAVRTAMARFGDGVQRVSVFDAGGRLLWTTSREAGSERVAGDAISSAVFEAFAVDGKSGLITPPIQEAASGPWMIEFYRAHRSAAGTLTGISMVSVDADVTRTLATKMGLLDRGFVALIRADGVVVASSGNPGGRAGGDLQAVMAQDGGEAGLVLRGEVAHFYSLASVPGTDLVVAVGVTEAEAMAPIDAAMEQVRRWALALSLALVVMAFAVNTVFRSVHSLTLERRRSNELYQREALLREIAETASDIIVILDQEMRAVFVNPAYRTILGVDPAEARGSSIGDRILDEDFEGVRQGIAALGEQGGSWRGVYRVRHADGSIRWLESEIVSVAGDESRFVAISRDVTQRIQDESALQVAQAELNALVRLGPGTFYRMTIDADGEEERWFPAGWEMLGFGTAEGATRRDYLDRLFGADLPVLADAVARCIRGGDATAEYRLLGPDQERRWVRDQMRLVKASEDETILFGYIVETTQERDDMARLRQVERLATLGEVAAGIAHEMNQPLAAIAMAAENGLRLLKDLPDDMPKAGRVEAKLTRIVEHAHRLSQITDAVCLFGRTDGNSAWEASADQVLTNVRVLVKPRLLAAGAVLEVDASDDLPLIKGSPVALEQALMNLVANSCDAYGSAAWDAARALPVVRIVIRAEADQVRIMVADRAGGIPADLMDRIFNPFFTTKQPGKGTGLGLSITYARITEMGGRITVRNRDGGAVFDIVMPAIPAQAWVETVA
jgi:PAS domain S-box-containing protein